MILFRVKGLFSAGLGVTLLTAGFGLSAQAARLPSEYQEVEYIETTTKGQWIDTGYVPSIATDVELKGSAPISVGDFKIFYWSRLTSGGGADYPAFACTIVDTKMTRLYHHSPGNTADTQDLLVPLTDEIEFVSKGRVATINDQSVTYASLESGVSLPAVPLFAMRNGTDAVSTFAPAKMRLYYLRFIEKGVFKRNFVPCYRKSDGAIGLYDLSGNSATPFYVNQDSTKGAFAKGPNHDTDSTVFRVIDTSIAGSASPTDGIYSSPNGTNFTCTASEGTNDTLRTRSRLLGYALGRYDPNTGAMTSVVTNYGSKSYTHNQSDAASHVLTWVWADESEVLVGGFENGMMTIDGKDVLSTGMNDDIVYTQLEYLQCTNKVYIDTGFVPTDTDIMEAEVRFTKVSGTQPLWSGRYSAVSNNVSCIYYGGSNSQLEWGRNNAGIKSSASMITVTQDHVITMNYATLEGLVDGVSVATLQSGDFSPGYPLWLFTVADKDVETSANNFGTYCLKRFDVRTKDGELKRHFVPARRESDGVLGVYDTVTKEFRPSKSRVNGCTLVPGAAVGIAGREVRRAVWVPYHKELTIGATGASGYEFRNWSGALDNSTTMFSSGQRLAFDCGKKLAPSFKRTLTMSSLACSGGSMEIIGNERIHTFGTNGVFTVEGEGEADVLIVGGGGGGGGFCAGGGGGGGGVVYRNAFHLTAGTYEIVVGRGGAAGRRAMEVIPGAKGTATTNWYTVVSTSGGDSSAFGLIAYGGGRGGMYTDTRVTEYSPESGGSGGGSATKQVGMGVNGQGHAGYASGNLYRPGGGGGAGGPATSPSGGPGLPFDISGRPRYYGGGGCAFNGINGVWWSPGCARANNIVQNGEDGIDGFGEGGAGGGDYTVYPNSLSRFGGKGGDGTVIIRYRTRSDRLFTKTANATGGLARKLELEGTKWMVHTFSNSGTITFPRRTLVQLLVVGGGGGGGNAADPENGNAAGGGAGGGVVICTNLVVEAGTHPIIVGEGGLTDFDGSHFRGGDSKAFGITAVGGSTGTGWFFGRELSTYGGGAINQNYGNGWYAAAEPRFGWGCASGRGLKSGGGGSGGGGGGAGKPGNSNAGGDGVMCDFFGEEQWFGGGGGGGIAWYKHAAGGKGGGGRGGTSWNSNPWRSEDADPGTPGTGGGGGGFANKAKSGIGGSGIVILRYQLAKDHLVVIYW